LLKYILRDELKEKLGDILKLVGKLGEEDTALGYLRTMLQYISEGTDKIDDKDLKKIIEDTIPQGGELMMTLADRWLQQGLKQGLQQGLKQGLQQGLKQGLQQGKQQGMIRGLRSGIELGLELKFGVEGLRMLPEIRKIEDVEVLRAVQEGLKMVNSPAELQRIYRDMSPDVSN